MAEELAGLSGFDEAALAAGCEIDASQQGGSPSAGSAWQYNFSIFHDYYSVIILLLLVLFMFLLSW